MQKILYRFVLETFQLKNIRLFKVVHHGFIAVSPGGTLEIHAGAKTLAAGTARGQILTADGQPYPFSPFSGDGHFTLSAPIRRLENLGDGSYLLQMDAGGSPQQFQIAVGGLIVVTLP